MEAVAIGERVLVPLDGSDLALGVLPLVRAVTAPGAEVTLLRVVPPGEPVRDLLGRVQRSAEDVGREYGEIGRRELAEAAPTLGEGRRVDPVVLVGDPGGLILETARERGCDLVALASHGRGAAGRWVFGSVADHVARHATVPVLIVRPGEGAPPVGPASVRELLVPLDGSERGARALPVAAALAGRLGAPVRLLTALDIAHAVAPTVVPEATFMTLPTPEMQAALEEVAQERLAEAAGRLRAAGATVETEIRTGSAGGAIAGAARPEDLIVMTSHGRGGARRLALGSVAEHLVRRGPCPVVLLRGGETAREGEAGERP